MLKLRNILAAGAVLVVFGTVGAAALPTGGAGPGAMSADQAAPVV